MKAASHQHLQAPAGQSFIGHHKVYCRTRISTLQQTSSWKGTTVVCSTSETASEPQPSSSSTTTTTSSWRAIDALEPEPTVKSHAVEVEEEEEDIFASKELIDELKDSKQFGQRGEAWFIAQLATMLLVLFPPLSLKGLLDLFGTLAVTGGLVFVLYGVFSLGRSLSPMPQPRAKHALILSGMYGYVRHPMYAGLLLISFGLAAITKNEARVALAALLWWILEQKVAVEEKALLERYPQYAEYKEKVKKFLPYIY